MEGNSMRKIFIGLALAAGLLGTAGTAQAAQVTHAVQTRACTSGSVGTGYQWQPPGAAWTWWKSASSPAGCYEIWPRAKSNMGLYYDGGKIKNTGTTSVANVASSDYSGMRKTWIYKELTGGKSCTRKQIYPLPGPWGSAACA